MAELLQYHLNFRGMSGRVVRFRVLDPDEVQSIEENGARAAGENADAMKMRTEQMKILLSTFIHSYTDPGQEPARVPLKDRSGKVVMDGDKPMLVIDGGVADEEKLKGVTWHKPTSAAALQINWKTVFGAKESNALRVLYVDHHEINQAELEMLLGKARPVLTEG